MSYSTPDIAKKTMSPILSPLDQVGMGGIEVPLWLEIEAVGRVMQMATADAYVNLVKPEAKGIHMSRLFIKLQEMLSLNTFDLSLVRKILGEFLHSHGALSNKAYLNISYKHPLEQKSLTSDHKSWRSYPVSYKCSLDSKNEFCCEIEFSILYSSTCPCSAALSRQALQEKFKGYCEEQQKQEMIRASEVYAWLGEEENMIATPHSQRSKATIRLNPENSFKDSLEQLISLTENSLKTAVQSIVKREDEKEFAKLNGTNLMFAEDAARRLKQCLSSLSNVSSFSVKVCHYESLHAHDAVAYAEG